MWNRVLAATGIALLAAGAFASCIFDPDKKPEDEEPPVAKVYEDLSEPAHVLNNLELSYNRRNITEYDKILDDRGAGNGFTFFFSPGDVGGEIPAQWGRAEEVDATGKLFDSQVSPPFPRCRRITMDIQFESGVTWVEVIPEDYPDETWLTATVYYEFAFEMEPDDTYIAVPGARTQFTVRNTGTVDAPRYKLVEWRDLAVNS